MGTLTVGAGVGATVGRFVGTLTVGAGVGAAVGDVVGFAVTGLTGFSGSPRFAGKLQCCQPSADMRHWALPQHCDVGWQLTHIAKQPTCSLG